MTALLLVWDGDPASFPDGWYATAVRATRDPAPGPHRPVLAWSVGNRTRATAGDRVFLLRQGTGPGIVASGHLPDGHVDVGPHWADPRRDARYATVSWDRVIPVEDRLGTRVLALDAPGRNWTFVRGGGGSLAPAVAADLETSWEHHTAPGTASTPGGHTR